MIWERIRQWVKDFWLPMLASIPLIICTISCAGTDENAWVCVLFGFGIGVVTMSLLFWFPTEDEIEDQQQDHCDPYATYTGGLFCIINGKSLLG